MKQEEKLPIVTVIAFSIAITVLMLVMANQTSERDKVALEMLKSGVDPVDVGCLLDRIPSLDCKHIKGEKE